MEEKLDEAGLRFNQIASWLMDRGISPQEIITAIDKLKAEIEKGLNTR